MKKLLFILFVLLSLSTLINSSNAQDIQNYTVTNNTGMTVVHIFISSNQANQWGQDIYPKDKLLDGETFNFKIKDSDHCLWDIKYVTENGTNFHMSGVDLCKTYHIILTK